MWRPWGKNKSTVRIHSSSSSSSPSPSSPFSFSSFKDIQSLCTDQPPQQQQQIVASPSKKPSVYHRVRLANSLIRSWSTHHQQPTARLPRSFSQPIHENDPIIDRSFSQPVPESDPIFEPEPVPFIEGAEQRVVVYFTSLRVVRPTFEACKSTLGILRGFRVALDERDVSMDASFLTELNRVMKRVGLTLPRVFIGGRYVGGADEVSKLNEIGELRKLLEGLPKTDPGAVCHVCGGYRFVLCDECDGSRKVYTDKGGFRTCANCNENGLLRCPSCFTSPVLSCS